MWVWFYFLYIYFYLSLTFMLFVMLCSLFFVLPSGFWFASNPIFYVLSSLSLGIDLLLLKLSGNCIQFLFEGELKAFQQSKQLNGVSAKTWNVCFRNIFEYNKVYQNNKSSTRKTLKYAAKEDSFICFLEKLRPIVNAFKVHRHIGNLKVLIPEVYNHTH